MIVNLDLGKLRDEANAWLLAQPPGRALLPDAIAHFKHHFCLPRHIVDAILRDRERDKEKDALRRGLAKEGEQ
jgi:hypothetical protein